MPGYLSGNGKMEVDMSHRSSEESERILGYLWRRKDLSIDAKVGMTENIAITSVSCGFER